MLKLRRTPKRVVIEESYWDPKPPRNWTWLWVLCGFALIISLLIAGQAKAINHDIGAGQLELTNNTNKQLAIAVNASAHFDIQGLNAAVTLQQNFKNPTDKWVNGRYVFPLPENAAVHFMQIQIGERIITSSIKEKQTAKKIFDEAKTAGKTAALTKQHRPNIFSQNIANIGPNEELSLTLKYSQPVTYDMGEFSLRFPMTMTPRYIPGEPNPETAHSRNGWALPTTQVPDANQISPWYTAAGKAADGNRVGQMRLSVTLNAGLPLANISSPYHQLAIQKTDDSHTITTATDEIPMNRDFVLTWRPTIEATPRAASFVETVGDNRYIKMMLLPPQQASNQAKLSRELLFILDTSGSMSGTSIKQAKRSLELALQRLSPEDSFNIYEFNSSYSQLFNASQPASAANVQTAKRFIKHLDANNGTEMAAPLSAALSSTAAGQAIRQVVFITDGSVGNEAALFKLINQQRGTARLFTIGIGSAPNSFFMRKAAEYGQGTFTHIGDISEVHKKMGDLFTKLESPVLSNIRINWPDGMDVSVWPQQLSDLYAGEPIIAYAQANYTQPFKLNISGSSASQTWQQSLQIPAADNTNTGVIAKAWAKAKITSLLDEKTLGGDETVIREKVLALALQHHLISPYTSLIAVEQRIRRPENINAQDLTAPLVIPHGQNIRALGYPQTATPALLHLVLSVLSIIAIALLRAVRKKHV